MNKYLYSHWIHFYEPFHVWNFTFCWLFAFKSVLIMSSWPMFYSNTGLIPQTWPEIDSLKSLRLQPMERIGLDNTTGRIYGPAKFYCWSYTGEGTHEKTKNNRRQECVANLMNINYMIDACAYEYVCIVKACRIKLRLFANESLNQTVMQGNK